uniref:NADH-ubiquinone oxidoreductase chain 2 n=1 Tax=Mytilus coruscus TaxID=42192 RepID=A0A075E382_MYTCO|nr:NADH dehydrogenase subunit 2 [Mytilus coruscus]AIA77031.1 NADH dehydrogenase subunit 2 [Mytilus coruscus]AZZ73311.1 NADH dehydrogenase subunit 2 [Mytilus coruscus]
MVSFVMSPMKVMSMSMMVIGTVLSVSSEELVGVWLGMELNLYGFLVVMNPDGHYIPEPCVKYFVVQSTGSILMLGGFVLLMQQFVVSGLMMSVIGTVLKSGISPLHSWVPSTIKNSSWLASGLMLTWQKVAPLVLLSMIMPLSGMWLVIGLMAMIGALGGLNQNSVRVMSAYSSFVHTSWMLLGLTWSSVVFVSYFLVYSMSVGLFFYGCSLMNKLSMSSQLSGAASGMGLLMLMGMPPFLGFLAKVLVFLMTSSSVIVLCIVGSVISLKYYIDFFYSMVMKSLTDKSKSGVKSMWMLVIIMNLMGGVVILVSFL